MFLNKTTSPTALVDFFRENKDKWIATGWLARQITPFCVCEKLGRFPDGRIRLLQHPEEFAQFLIYAARSGVKSYAEIGVHSGGSFYLMDSYLRAHVPDYRGGVAVDISDQNLRDWNDYATLHGTVEFRKANSATLNLDKEFFDLAFIDGWHAERGVRSDVSIIRGHCRIVAFHDIFSKKDAVGKVWRELLVENPTSPYREFIRLTPRLREMMGLGVLEWNGGKY